MKLLEIAMSQYGVQEIQGLEHNPVIVNYSKEIGYGGIIDDETAWCSIFMNWVAMKAGLKRSERLNARSWLKVGKEVTEPQQGDVVIFWRQDPNSWKGHVGIYISHNLRGDSVYCLGGNQGNMVQINSYTASRILGYRRLGV